LAACVHFFFDGHEKAALTVACFEERKTGERKKRLWRAGKKMHAADLPQRRPWGCWGLAGFGVWGWYRISFQPVEQKKPPKGLINAYMKILNF